MQSADAIPVELPMDGDTSDWLVMDTIDPSTHSITGPGPDTLAVVPPVTLKAEHLTSNWGDMDAARAWERVQRKITTARNMASDQSL
jgi:hypothetical protein